MGDWRAMGSNARRRMGAPNYHGGGAEPDVPSSRDFAVEGMRGRIGEVVSGADDPIAEAHMHLGEAKRLDSLRGQLPDGAIHTNRVLHQNLAAEARRRR